MENEEVKLIVTEVTGEPKSIAEIERETIEQHTKESFDKTKETTDPIIETEIDDTKFFEIASKKLGKEVKSLDDLKEKEIVREELPEDVSAFYKYKKETGRGWEDFTKAQRDFSTIEPNELISEYLTAKEEGLDPEDIETMMKKLVIDEDYDTEDVIADKKLAYKKTLREAKQFFKKQQENYKVPLVPSSAAIPDEDKESYESYKQNISKAKSIKEENAKLSEVFNQKTNEVLTKEFKGFEFKVKIGNKEEVLTFAPGTADELKAVNSNPVNFFKRFMDDKGVMQDVKGYHRDFSVGMNPDKFAQFFVEQGYRMAIEANDKEMKNINMGVRNAPSPIAKDNIRVSEVQSPPPQATVNTKYR